MHVYEHGMHRNVMNISGSNSYCLYYIKSGNVVLQILLIYSVKERFCIVYTCTYLDYICTGIYFESA